MEASIRSRTVEVEGLTLHYLEAGEGEAVVHLHGIPTSAHLYRNVLPAVGRHARAIALDLPAFGKSDKPLDVRYTFRFYERILEGFLDALSIPSTGLVVHDFGGPVGLYWAVRHPARVRRLALLNTLFYPEPSWALVIFLLAIRTPLLRDWLAGPSGIAAGMRLGIHHKEKVTPELLAAYQEPFHEPAARQAMLAASGGLSPAGMKEIAMKLPRMEIPMRAIYGVEDWILPDVAKTMERLRADHPALEVFPLEGCGHFLQEDEPDQLATLLAEFFS